MDEVDFATLRVLDETHNVTRAAERLYMTQSALSKRIHALEDELGCELLIRSRRGVTFTPAGEMALAHALTAEHELALLRRNIAAYGDEVAGTLRAGFSVNYAATELPYVLAQYRASYPRVRLSIRTGESARLHQSMLAGELDACVLRGELPWDGPRRRISSERIYVIEAREHEGHDLHELPYIDHQTDAAQTQLMTRWLHEHGLEVHADDIRVNDLSACARMVELGLGWALVPEITLRNFNGIAIPCDFADGTPFMRSMYALWQKDADGLPQVQALVDLVCPKEV